ncbi:MAG: DMT family transporter [Gammaproteobacteria bacterium]|nr:DMT family transporter [Gammaproteobacteria bacterium]
MLGYAAAVTVVLIWSAWLVVSRSAAQSPITIFDLAALRYGISAIIALPFVLYYKPWRTMSITRIATLTFLLGPFYILFVFGGFEFAPAAHGGIFMNGALPAITLLIGWTWLAERVSVWQLIGVVLIVIGASLAVADASHLSLTKSWRGDLMFLVGAMFFSAYLVFSRLWHITTTQILLCGSVINALLYVPIWVLFLPSGIAITSQSQFIVQILFQGLVPNLLGLLLVAAAVRRIGSAATAAFMAAVPGIGALLSLLFLGEVPGLLGWFSLAVLTPGIMMVVLIRKR